MRRSEGRFLCTQAGSLPRGSELEHLLRRIAAAEEVNETTFHALIDAETAEVVRRQQEVGLDVAGNGEVSRTGFADYAERISGFGGVSRTAPLKDFLDFPEYAELKRSQMVSGNQESELLHVFPACQGKVRYEEDLATATAELDRFDAVLEGAGRPFAETFVTAPTPGAIAGLHARSADCEYESDEEYVLDLAKELRREYELVIRRGHVLQLDSPDLALDRAIGYADRPLADFLEHVERNVEAINLAVEGLPADRIRLHVCWGNLDTPHTSDVAMKEILPIVYRARVGAIGLPFANPRHAHEHKLFRTMPLPDDKVLFAGVIDTTTNYVEHPEVVADRLEAIATSLGSPERLIASTDCGFHTTTDVVMVARDVVWAKLATLVDGARLASERLFA
jgi:5-methyltetrahydropteroyltriglutamate--homocysteine methyltransferase